MRIGQSLIGRGRLGMTRSTFFTSQVYRSINRKTARSQIALYSSIA